MIDLRLGDSLEVMKSLPDASVDCVIADPPYGARRPSGWRKSSQRFTEVHGNDGVHTEWLRDTVRILRDGGACYVFTCWTVYGEWAKALADVGLRLRSCIVWDKMRPGLADMKTCYAPQHELILFAAKGRHELRLPRPKDVIRVQRLYSHLIQHPYEKPVELMLQLIATSTDAGGVVLDPFMGSGPVPVTCARLGRDCVGIELDESYFNVAKRRVETAQAQLVMNVQV